MAPNPRLAKVRLTGFLAVLHLILLGVRGHAQVASGSVPGPTSAALALAPAPARARTYLWPWAGTTRPRDWTAPRYWGGRTTYDPSQPAASPFPGSAPTGGMLLTAPPSRTRRPLTRWWPGWRELPRAKPWLGR